MGHHPQNHNKVPMKNLAEAPAAMIAAATGVVAFMITFRAIVFEESTNISTMCTIKGEKSHTIIAKVKSLK